MNTMKSPFSVASADCGYGWAKGKSAIGEATIKSLIGPAVDIAYQSDISTPGTAGLTVAIDGQTYFVGERAERQSPLPVGPQNRERSLTIVKILVLTALHQAGARGIIDRLVTGLPVAWYADDEEELVEILTGKHDFVVNGEAAHLDIKFTKVIPQPMGTVLLHMINTEGMFTDPLKLSRRQAAVIDIGYCTSDGALVDNREYMGESSDSIDTAGGAYYDLLRLAIKIKYNRLLTPLEAEAAARTGKMMLWGNEITLLPEWLDEQLRPVIGRVMTFIQDLWPLDKAKGFAVIFVSGGNGYLFYDAIRTVFPSAVLVSEPHLANVRGFYGLALLQERVARDKIK